MAGLRRMSIAGNGISEAETASLEAAGIELKRPLMEE
jgi:hypothetical protein